MNGVVFRDDVQIVRVRAEKVYAETPGLDVTLIPYAMMRPHPVAPPCLPPLLDEARA